MPARLGNSKPLVGRQEASSDWLCRRKNTMSTVLQGKFSQTLGFLTSLLPFIFLLSVLVNDCLRPNHKSFL